MATLLIVESPAKGKTIEGYLGTGYRVSASVGHIRDLPEVGMGVSPPDFKPNYVFTERGKEVTARLKRLAAECDEVILASDLDREGESIAWHLQQVLGLKSPKRLVFNEITKKALIAALAAPQSIDTKKVAAQEARRITDRLIGYKVSPLIAEYLGDRKLSAGRVQSIAVRLVDDRENEISAFNVVTHYNAEIKFGEWTATWANKALLDGQEYWTDKDFAQKVAELTNFKVISCAESETKSSPPAPFTTSTLQAAGSNALGFAPKRTMELAQKLYEQGVISYMRTDSTNLSADALEEIAQWCKGNGLPVLSKPRTWDAKGGAQEAHEAVRPSHFDVTEAGEDDDQRKLYRLIWLRAVGCQLEDARFAVRTAKLEATDPVDGKTISFEARGKTLVHKGWKSLTPVDTAEDPDDAAAADAQDSDNPVPELSPGDAVQATSGKVVQTKTKPPARYTEASLVKEMEKRGIGRPSTFGAIIEEIKDRSYVEVFSKKKQLKSTPRGSRLIKALIGRFSFIEYNFTKILEEQLSGVESGKTQYVKLLTLINDRLNGEIEKFKSSQPLQFPCPKCGRGLVMNLGKKKKDSSWWSCAGYTPDDAGCDYSALDDDGKPGASSAPVLTEHNCGSCGKPLIHREKEGEGGWKFFGCSGFKDGCTQSYPDKDGEPDMSSPKIKQEA